MSDSNSTALTSDDLYYLATLCGYFAGNADQRWWNVPTGKVLFAVGQYFNETAVPNPEDVIKLTGWSEEVYQYLDAQVVLNASAPYYASLLPLSPHPLQSHWIYIVFGVFTVISTIVLALRLWSRLSIAGRLQAFDWVTVVAYVAIVAWSALTLDEQRVVGPNAFQCDQTYNEIIGYERDWDILMFTYPIVIFIIKLSLLLFYHQLSSWFPLRCSVYITGFLCFGNAMAAIFTWVFQCNYPNLWDHQADMNLDCKLDQVPIVVAMGAISIATDIIIWLSPMPLVWQLQLNTRERVLAIGTFGIGLVACVGSMMRLIAVKKYLAFGQDASGDDSRQPINCWAIVEMNLALICACVPALRALILKHFPTIISRGSDGTDISKGSKGSSNYKGHGKPSIVSEEDGQTTAELSDFHHRQHGRQSEHEKTSGSVQVWSPTN